ncbi:MAG: hypothetical protein QOK40_1436 [Miltoncostaeaceae bacterium]|nr:hypothetical protein [Miltoncostaeaceae bacterium]
MSAAHDPHDERLREYFGHDRVALFGAGGMPAAPPAPPGSPARRQGEAALADALSKVGKPGPRIGAKPAAPKIRPSLAGAMRSRGERALMEAGMRDSARRNGSAEPLLQSNPFWRLVFVPAYRALPWAVKRTMATTTSGVRGWSTDGEDHPSPVARVAAPLQQKARSLAKCKPPGGARAFAGIAALAVVAGVLARVLRRR